MTSLSEYKASHSVKLLMVGDSGVGKTGSIAALANAGFKLYVYDFDNGLDFLAANVKPEFRGNVRFKHFMNRPRELGGKVVAAGGDKAWTRFLPAIDEWVEDDGSKHGSIFSWGPDTIAVFDSLTYIAKAAMQYVLLLNGWDLKHPPQIQHWGDAQRLVELFLGMIYQDTVTCHTIVCSHIDRFGEPNPKGESIGEKKTFIPIAEKWYPTAIGSKLPPRIARYFNNFVMADIKPTGQRVIRTVADGKILLKVGTNAKDNKPEYPIETGLVEIFRSLGATPPGLDQGAKG